MNTRVKELRNYFGLNQKDFARKLGVTDSAISKIEKGHQTLSDPLFLSICSQFNISKEWLKNGTGDMLDGSNVDEDMIIILNTLLEDETDLTKKTFLKLARLNEDDFNLVENLINRLSKK